MFNIMMKRQTHFQQQLHLFALQHNIHKKFWLLHMHPKLLHLFFESDIIVACDFEF